MSRELRLSRAVVMLSLLAPGCRASHGGRATSGSIQISHAVIPAPVEGGEATAFCIIANTGDGPITLVAARSPEADSALLHDMAGGQMRHVAEVVIRAHQRLRLVPGGYHLMLEGLRRPLEVGDTVRLELTFDPGGTVPVGVPVLRYTEALDELPTH
jgi:copper(I)-binding protein